MIAIIMITINTCFMGLPWDNVCKECYQCYSLISSTFPFPPTPSNLVSATEIYWQQLPTSITLSIYTGRKNKAGKSRRGSASVIAFKVRDLSFLTWKRINSPFSAGCCDNVGKKKLASHFETQQVLAKCWPLS